MYKTELEVTQKNLSFGSMQILISSSPEDLWARQYQFGVLDKWAPYLDSLEPLGLRCCVGCVWCVVVWRGVVWCDKVWCD